MYILTDIITFYNYFLNYSLPQARHLHIYVYSCIQIGDIFGNYVVKSFVFQTKYFSVLPLFCFRTSTFAISISVFFFFSAPYICKWTDRFVWVLPFPGFHRYSGKTEFQNEREKCLGSEESEAGVAPFLSRSLVLFSGSLCFFAVRHTWQSVLTELTVFMRLPNLIHLKR